MRLVTFETAGGGAKAGAFIEDDRRIVDLQAAHEARYGKASPLLASVLAICEADKEGLDIAASMLKAAAGTEATTVARSAATLHAPIPTPPQIRDYLCFEKHLIQAFAQVRKVRASLTDDPEAAMREMEEKNIFAIPPVWYERPLYYHPSRFSVVGPEVDVDWPEYSNRLDFELEFGFYVGKAGKNITKANARDHIFGYTIFNDISARDEQSIVMPGQLGPGKGKDFDGGNPMGPCLVTADEIPDPYALEMKVRVNGEEWGRGNSSEMHWKFEDCIADASRSESLHSGEFFASGTVGNGSGVEHMRFLKPGDVVELEVERIGVLRNRVVRR